MADHYPRWCVYSIDKLGPQHPHVSPPANGRAIFNVFMVNRAALEKLAIRGIRSFDDKRTEVIEFFTPVTVIVGQNGSGKTVSFAYRAAVL